MKPEKDKARNYELSNVGQAHISLVWKLFTLEFGFVSIAVNSNNLGCHQKLSEGLTIKMFCPNRFSSKYMNKSLKEIILLCVQGITFFGVKGCPGGWYTLYRVKIHMFNRVVSSWFFGNWKLRNLKSLPLSSITLAVVVWIPIPHPDLGTSQNVEVFISWK